MLKRFTFVTHSTSNSNFSVVSSLVEICCFKNIYVHDCPWVYLIHEIILHVHIVLSPVNVFIYFIVQRSPQHLDCSAKNVNS